MGIHVYAADSVKGFNHTREQARDTHGFSQMNFASKVEEEYVVIDSNTVWIIQYSMMIIWYTCMDIHICDRLWVTCPQQSQEVMVNLCKV